MLVAVINASPSPLNEYPGFFPFKAFSQLFPFNTISKLYFFIVKTLF